MFRYIANNPHDTLALDYFAFIAHFLYGSSYFHDLFSFQTEKLITLQRLQSCQYLGTYFRYSNRMFKMRGKTAIAGNSPPTSIQHAHFRPFFINHRFNGQNHPGLQPYAPARLPEVWYLWAFMEILADTDRKSTRL